VIYVHDNSQTLLNYLDEVASSKSNSSVGLIPYLKRYDERTKRKTRTITRRYYDEREWRYVPNGADFVDLRNSTSAAAAEEIAKENNALGQKKYRLRFSADDLTYIFVEKTDDVPWLSKR